MKGLTHSAAGMITGILLSDVIASSPEQAVIVTACSVLGSLLPDIDICTSKLGRMIAPISFTIQLIAGHRSLFHSLLPLILSNIACSLFFSDYRFYIIAASVGFLTHLLLDMFNPSGVPLMWPVKVRCRLANFRSGGIIDWLLGIALTLTAGILLIRQIPALHSLTDSL